MQMPDSKLVMFGKPAVGAAVMVAAPLAALDIPLKVLVWEDRNGAVSVSYNSPGFLAGRHHLEGALRAPFNAVESIVEEELLDHSPAAHVHRPRLDYESHATGLDRNELGALLVAAGLGPPAEHALISLLASTGSACPKLQTPTSGRSASNAGTAPW